MMETQIPLNSNKLVNFNVPHYLITNFDEVVKFKNVSRTSMLIRLMESYVRSEFNRLEEDNKINQLIMNVKLRNHNPPQNMKRYKEEIDDEEDLLPPPILQSLDNDDWEEDLMRLG